jgi:hypothetical protein
MENSSEGSPLLGVCAVAVSLDARSCRPRPIRTLILQYSSTTRGWHDGKCPNFNGSWRASLISGDGEALTTMALAKARPG